MDTFGSFALFEIELEEWAGISCYDDISGDIQSSFGVSMLFRGPFMVEGKEIAGVVITEWDSGNRDIEYLSEDVDRIWQEIVDANRFLDEEA